MLGQRREGEELGLEHRTAADNERGDGGEKQSDTLHVRRPPVDVVSSPTPLVMEEPCPLRSLVC